MTSLSRLQADLPVMTGEQQLVAERRLAMLEVTEQIATDYAARILHLREHPEDKPVKLLLVNGVPARLLS